MIEPVHFGAFTFNPASQELRKGGTRVRVPGQSLAILAMLLERPGELVTRAEIQARLWPHGTVVEFEQSLNSAVKRLRDALSDTAATPRFVETIPRKGYRFVGMLETTEHEGAELAPGTVISHYRILAPAGRGAMGVVYKAEDTTLGRTVALKFLPEELAAHEPALDRFRREARMIGALNHPGICTVYELGAASGHLFLAMEFLDGESLRERMARGVVTEEEFRIIALQAATALGAAHAQGVVHRDIKPDNLFLTRQGTVKLMDFGLAKLIEEEGGTAPQSAVTGTSGYMSPEQARGEALDQRSDLFSLGVVLYEMLGGRPQEGDVVRRCLEKDPDRRLQSAAEVRLALESLSVSPALPALPEPAAGFESDTSPLVGAASAGRAQGVSLSRRRSLALAGLITLIAVSALVLLATRRGPAQRPEPKFRRLTANPPNNPATDARISPDGKFLAYSDRSGIRLQVIETGETRTIPRPQGLSYEIAEWTPVGWFPDGTRLLAQANSKQGEHSGIWVISVIGGAPREIHDGGYAWSVSPDGSLVAFASSNSLDDLWVMAANGEDRRRIVGRDEGKVPLRVVWSPDNLRVAYQYFRLGPAGWEWRMENPDLKGGLPTLILSDPRISGRYPGGLWWLPGGRLIYSLGESSAVVGHAAQANLWEIHLDQRSGQPAGNPTRITNWSEFLLNQPNASADGRRLVFSRETSHNSVYVGDLEAGGARLKAPPRRLTLDERSQRPFGWTADSRAVLFDSDRNGDLEIYKQALDQDSAELLAADQRANEFPRLSADGAWVIYDSWDKSQNSDRSELRRVPVSGGPSQLVLTSKDNIRNYKCARPPATVCLVGEMTVDGKQRLFTVFDPVRGRGREVSRMASEPGRDYNWDLSPDGSRIAMLFPAGGDRIRLLPLGGVQPLDLTVKKWSVLSAGPYWAPDGKGFYVSSVSARAATVLYVDLKGNATPLWEQAGNSLTWAIPSPDGRRLAILGTSVDSNVWMAEDF